MIDENQTIRREVYGDSYHDKYSQF